jgi:hypothetical protein
MLQGGCEKNFDRRWKIDALLPTFSRSREDLGNSDAIVTLVIHRFNCIMFWVGDLFYSPNKLSQNRHNVVSQASEDGDFEFIGSIIEVKRRGKKTFTFYLFFCASFYIVAQELNLNAVVVQYDDDSVIS